MSGERRILDATEIDDRLRRMAQEIRKAHKDIRSLALVGIHTRGVFLARRLQKHIEAFEGVKPFVGEIDITLYRDDWTQLNARPIVKTTEIPFSVNGKKIVLVDDVLNTGRTIRAAMDAVMDFGRPSRIELAVLIDRGHRELPIQSDYTGHCVRTECHQMIDVRLKESDGEDKVVLALEPKRAP